MLAKIVVLLTMITTVKPSPDDYQIWNGTYHSYVRGLGDSADNITLCHNRATQKLSQTSLESVWLPIRRRHLNGWFWLTGQFHVDRLSGKTEKFGRDCGVLRAADMLLDDTMCNRNYRKYLCQTAGESCRNGRDDCYNHNGRSYWLYYGIDITWYEARTGCTYQGQELSTLPEKSRQAVMRWLQSSITSFFDVWIGLRRSDYFIEGHNTSTDIFHWKKSEPCPCESKFSCAVVIKSQAESFWKPRSCKSTVSFIRFAVGGGISPGMTTPVDDIPLERNESAVASKEVLNRTCEAGKTNSISTMHTDGMRIAFIVTVVVLILILTALIVSFLICQRGRKKRKQKDIEICEIKPKTTVDHEQDNVPEGMKLMAEDSVCLSANKDQIETEIVKGQMHATKQNLRDMHDKYSALQQERENKEDECEILKKHNDKLKKENEQLLSRLKEAPMELNELERAKQVEIQEIQNTLSAANASNDELKNDIVQLTLVNQEKTQLLAAVGGREVNIGELLEKQTKLENDRTLAREELSMAKAERQKDRDAAKTQVGGLLRKTKQLESELQIYQTEAKQYNQKVKELERQNEELLNQVTSMGTRIDQMNEARNQENERLMLQRRDQMLEEYHENVYQGGKQNARPEECNTVNIIIKDHTVPQINTDVI